jgi:hypothetical protein
MKPGAALVDLRLSVKIARKGGVLAQLPWLFRECISESFIDIETPIQKL